jgi:ribosomal-protein-alanine N-acetyltransferase
VAAVRNTEVLGYLIARVIADEAEILNLAVTPDARRRGIGSALLQAGLDHCTRHRVTAVFLEVRESNQQARALYGAHGFRAVGQRAGYYRNPPEDAMVLRLTLGGVA